MSGVENLLSSPHEGKDLQISEKYRSLFNSIEQGYILFKPIYDSANCLVDFVILEINATAEKYTGLKNDVKYLSELAAIEPIWLEVGTRVVVTGKQEQIELYRENLQRWFNARTLRIGDEGSHLILALFDDITTRKKIELDLAFLAEISQDLAHFTDLNATMYTLGKKIGNYFNVSHVTFCEVDAEEQYLTVTHEWHRTGSQSLIGTYLISDYHNEDFVRICRGGQTYILRDSSEDTRVDSNQMASISLGSAISVPLLYNGVWKFNLSLSDQEPRLWREDEQKLLRELTARIGMCLERAQAVAALLESERRLALELADTKRLQQLSTQLIQENNIEELYMHIVDAAIALMRSDAGSLQMYFPEKNALQLLASRGLHEESIKYWEWVHLDSASNCGEALRKGERVWVPNVKKDASPSSSKNDEAYLLSNICSVQSTPLISRNGQVVGMISTHWGREHSPSEREFNLFNVLVRQAADLIERKLIEQALKKADRRKDEFLATLSHELRNPLVPITNALYVLKHQKEGSDQQPLLALMEQQVDHIMRLVDDLLEVSRITTGKIELRKELIPLTEVIHSAMEISKPLLESHRHQLEISLIQEPLILNADMVRLTQVFSNLLNNAAKYTPKGGTITITVAPKKEGVMISVRDNGIGIAPSLLPDIFEVFAQGKHISNYNPQGLGIGLALARSLVELHGGTIGAYSAGIGQGSEFSVCLPLGKNPPTEPIVQTKESNPMTTPLSEYRVLLVDDNPTITASLSMVLECWDIQVQAVNSGESALAALETFQPHTIFLDIGMPGMDGHQLARAIRQKPEYAHIRLIALTGWGQEGDRLQTTTSGFDEHLTKPVNIKLLLTLLEKHKALNINSDMTL